MNRADRRHWWATYLMRRIQRESNYKRASTSDTDPTDGNRWTGTVGYTGWVEQRGMDGEAGRPI